MPTPAHIYHKKELALGYCLCPIFRAMDQYKTVCSGATSLLYSHYKCFVGSLQLLCSASTSGL